jgi:hypothetical protein
MVGRIAGHGTPEAVAQAMGRPLLEATKAAADVGVNINDLVGKPLGGLAGLRVPFTEPSAILGTGSTGQAIANKLGSFYDKALYSAPGRYLSAAFDPTVKGALEGGVRRHRPHSSAQLLDLAPRQAHGNDYTRPRCRLHKSVVLLRVIQIRRPARKSLASFRSSNAVPPSLSVTTNTGFVRRVGYQRSGIRLEFVAL